MSQCLCSQMNKDRHRCSIRMVNNKYNYRTTN